MMSTEDRIAALQEKHADIEKRIEQEFTRPHPDDSVIGQMKREKLRIKDEISRLEHT